MEVTANQALNILGRIAFANERLNALLCACYDSGRYSDINEVQDIILAPKGTVLLPAKVTVTFDCRNIIEAVEQIKDVAKETGQDEICQDASTLLIDLVNLAADTKRQNKT